MAGLVVVADHLREVASPGGAKSERSARLRAPAEGAGRWRVIRSVVENLLLAG